MPGIVRKRWLTGLAVVMAIAGLSGRGSDLAPDLARHGDTGSVTASVSASSSAQGTPTLGAIASGTLRLEGQAVDDDDRPIGGARITLDGARIATTELDGSFAFDGLAEGSYTVIAESDTLYGEDLDVRLDDTSDPVTLKMKSGPTIAVHVVTPQGAAIAGAKVETSSRAAITGADGLARLRGVDSDFEFVSVEAPGREHMRERVVTGDDPTTTIDVTIVLGPGAMISGIVLDEDGKAVPEAYVELERGGHRPLDRRRTETVVADATGAWQIAALGAGRYNARASSDAHLATPDLAIDLDGTQDRSGIVLHVANGGEIAGLVVSSSGAPVAEARVMVGSKSATTDANGRFVARGLAPDTYDISAITDRAAAKSQSVTLTGREHLEVKLAITSWSIAGIVVDTHGNPIEDASVSAHSSDPHGWGYARTDEHGRFDLGGLPPGEYDVVAERADQVSRTTATPLRITTETRKLTLVLPELSTITGRVVLDGEPVAYYGVVVTDDDATQTYERPTPIRDRQGTFVKRGLVPGSWNVAIVGPGFARRVIEHVEMTPGGSTDLGEIRVEHGETIRGYVRDDKGAPIAGAVVRIYEGWDHHDDDRLRALLRNNFSTTTDARGAYQIDGMRPGTADRAITATHPSFGSSLLHEVAPGETAIDLVIGAQPTDP